MIRQAFKLVWNRKRASALLIAEIFFSFVVLFAVGSLGLYLAANYRQPLGFEWRDVWLVAVSQPTAEREEPPSVAQEQVDLLLRELHTLPEVDAAASLVTAPYSPNTYEGHRELAGQAMTFDFSEVSDGLLPVLRLELVAGRWFEPGDDAAARDPLVIDQAFAEAAFGSADAALGQSTSAEATDRIVGVIRDYRRAGELSGPGFELFERRKAGNPEARLPSYFLLRTQPGTAGAFEQRLNEHLHRVAPAWSFDVEPLSRTRERSFRGSLAPLAAGGVIAAFLLAMVALGLSGVLWQNVVQRTRELGLRRAAGARRGDVVWQIVLEQLALATFALTLGVALAGQVPLLGLVPLLPASAWFGGLGVGVGVILLLVSACALYPSWLASRIAPADALRWE